MINQNYSFTIRLTLICNYYRDKLSPNIIAFGRELAINNRDPDIAKRYFEIILKNCPRSGYHHYHH